MTYTLVFLFFFSFPPPPVTAVAQLLVFLCDLSPSLKSKLSCQRAVNLTYQFSSGQKSCSAKLDLLLKHLWPRAKKYDPLKVNCEVLSFLPTNCSAALPPQGHLRSRLHSPRDKVSFLCAGIETLEGENHPFLPKRSTNALYHQQPRDYRSLWWIANPTEQMTG